MINMPGNNKVYTVPEINAMLKKMKETTPYNVVSELPSAIDVDPSKTYWLVTGKSVKIQTGTRTVTNAVTNESHQEPVYTEYPEVIAFVYLNDTWYCTDYNVPLTREEIADIVDEIINPSPTPVEPEDPNINPVTDGPMTPADVIQIWNSVPDGR